MKKIIIFSLLYQVLFFIFSLLLILIKERFGSELFAYAFFTNVMYFFIGFIFNILLIKLIYKYRKFYLLFTLGVLIIFNLFVYILTDSDKIFITISLFRTFTDGWYINLFYHLSIVLSVITLYFLSKKGIFDLKK